MGDADKLKITIDEDTCIGDGLCCDDAPDTFEMNDDEKAVVKNPVGDDRAAILEAANNCPVEAIRVEDTETGEVLYPEE
ncbi:MAG: ferredoxin [Planctomycetota bacterium]